MGLDTSSSGPREDRLRRLGNEAAGSAATTLSAIKDRIEACEHFKSLHALHLNRAAVDKSKKLKATHGEGPRAATPARHEGRILGSRDTGNIDKNNHPTLCGAGSTDDDWREEAHQSVNSAVPLAEQVHVLDKYSHRVPANLLYHIGIEPSSIREEFTEVPGLTEIPRYLEMEYTGNGIGGWTENAFCGPKGLRYNIACYTPLITKERLESPDLPSIEREFPGSALTNKALLTFFSL